MTRESIKAYMVNRIRAVIEDEIENNIEKYIDEDRVQDYMWNKDYGLDKAIEFIEDNADDIIEDYLDEIYSEIESFDLE